MENLTDYLGTLTKSEIIGAAIVAWGLFSMGICTLVCAISSKKDSQSKFGGKAEG